MALHAILLAAGKGTRMRSDKVKVAHEVAGKPVIRYVLDAVYAVGVDRVYMVVGHQGDLVRSLVPDESVSFVEQAEQLGTGHAVMQVEPFVELGKGDSVVVMAGDAPLITPETLEKLYQQHKDEGALATIFTVKMDEPASYGRILRDSDGNVLGIREAKDCSAEQLQIQEINSGMYLFDVDAMFKALSEIEPSNSQGEYYLTDVIEVIRGAGGKVGAYMSLDADEASGINTRMDLAMIYEALCKRVNLRHMVNGVTLLDPGSTYIDDTVEIAADTVVGPCSVLEGQTRIGKGCRIGPHSYLKDAVVEDGVVVEPYSRVVAGG